MWFECCNITKRFGSATLLNDLQWRTADNESWSVIGNSGAGKTTLLRILAGLEVPDSGHVLFDGRPRTQKSPTIGMVFQDYGLWPHLTVREHIECVQKGVTGKERRIATDALLSEMQLDPAVWNRRVINLSGGEAQRLAIARALALKPAALLLDEPLAQLDSPLRHELIGLLQGIRHHRQTMIVCVTHSWSDAVYLTNFVAILHAGKIVQAAPIEVAYQRPACVLTAELTGPTNTLPVRLVESGKVLVSSDPNWRIVANSDLKVLVVRPQQIHLSEATPKNSWTICGCVPRDAGWQVTLTSATDDLDLLVSARPRLTSEVCIELTGEIS